MPKKTSLTAFCATLIASTLCTVPSVAQTNEENLTPVVYMDVLTMNIGFRPSQRAGERSSLKWLSRAIKDVPDLSTYVVKWHTYRDKKKLDVSIRYDQDLSTLSKTQWPSSKRVAVKNQHQRPTYEESWQPVQKETIHSAAKKNGIITNSNIFK